MTHPYRSVCSLFFLLTLTAAAFAPVQAGAQEPQSPARIERRPPPRGSNAAAPAPAAEQQPQSSANEGKAAGRSPSSPSARANNSQLVSIDFNNVDIGVFIKFISDLTKRNFVVDDKVRGKVTIISPGKITVEEAYRVFESVLEVYGFATVQAGEITKIVPSPEARTKSIKTRLQEEAGSDDTVITQIIPLRYADPNEIKNLFAPLISRNSIIQSYPPTNTLIVTDVSSNIKRLLKILQAIDVTGVGQQISIIPAENASAAKLVTLLETIFRSSKKPKPGGEKDMVFVADERTNSIVMLASEGDAENVRRLIKTLDRETPRSQGNINVYYLEHANAEDMAKVLQDIPQKSTGDAKTPEKPAAPVVSSKVRIAADKATNSLIITADAEDYKVLEAIIKKIDIPRAMVYIEALIMEVNASKDFQLGTEWVVGDKGSYKDKNFVYGGGFKGDSPLFSTGLGSTTGTTSSNVTISPNLLSGFSLGIFGEALNIAGVTFPSISAVINAYKKDNDVRILSTPQILTTDNQEAKIYVGKNVPFQTTAALSSASIGQVYNSYEYRDVGKTLKITPQISKDRQVRLTLSLEVTSLESTTDNRPTTLKRTVDTTAIVGDGNTVVLGGLIDDNSGKTVVKVPCLGEIPGFGNLFRNNSTAFERSNLYIFLTPKVIQNDNEAKSIASDKRSQIESLSTSNIKLYERQNTNMPVDELRIPAGQEPKNQPASQISPNPGKESSARENPQEGNYAAANAPQGGTQAAAPTASQDPARPQAEPAAPHQEMAPALAAESDLKEPVKAEPDQAEHARDTERTESKAGPGFTVQVASVQSAEKASQLITLLTGKGYAAYSVRTESNGMTWYRIRIGYFAGKKDAYPIMQQLKADQFTPVLIKL